MSVSVVYRFGVFLWMAAGWYLLLFVMGLMPNTPNDPHFLDFLPVDKFVHAAAYGIWGMLLYLDRRVPGWVLIPTCGLALFQESTQLWSATRSFEWLDWGADCVGIIMGFAFSRIVLKKWLLFE